MTLINFKFFFKLQNIKRIYSIGTLIIKFDENKNKIDKKKLNKKLKICTEND